MISSCALARHNSVKNSSKFIGWALNNDNNNDDEFPDPDTYSQHVLFMRAHPLDECIEKLPIFVFYKTRLKGLCDIRILKNPIGNHVFFRFDKTDADRAKVLEEFQAKLKKHSITLLEDGEEVEVCISHQRQSFQKMITQLGDLIDREKGSLLQKFAGGMIPRKEPAYEVIIRIKETT